MNEDMRAYEKPKPWERQAGESNMWFDRFHRFLLMGSSRSLDQSYREVMNERRVAFGREKLPKGARAGGSWRKKAMEYDWWGRAEAWDNNRRVEAMKTVSDALDTIRTAAPEAVAFQINMMRGFIKVPTDQEGVERIITLGPDEIAHMRLAANSILNRAGVVYDGPQGDEDDGEIQVVGITIHKRGD